jgi:hypothetical protein
LLEGGLQVTWKHKSHNKNHEQLHSSMIFMLRSTAYERALTYQATAVT